MQKSVTTQVAQSSKGMWSTIQEAPWYAPVLISLITALVIAFKAFLNYLNKKEELQILDRKHIRECNLHKLKNKKVITQKAPIKGGENAK